MGGKRGNHKKTELFERAKIIHATAHQINFIVYMSRDKQAKGVN